MASPSSAPADRHLPNSQNATTGGNASNPSLADVSPAAQADVCGNGVAVIGSGSSATCANSQSETTDGGGTTGVSPEVAVGVCGNGVAVIGSGSTATCADSQVIDDPGTTPGGGGSDGGSDSSTSGLAAVSPASAAHTPAAGSLAFTGTTRW